jgi:glycine cleavage system aminomethyltransferase T
MSSPGRLYHLALRDLHQAAGAVTAVRGEWSLPAHYGGSAAEYTALRSNAVVFDRSHHSRFMVTGTDALDVLKAAFAGHVEELEEGRAMRTVALNSRGEIADIVLITRTGGIAYLVTGEPGQRMATDAHLRAQVGPDFDVNIDDRTESTCLIGIAGPRADEAIQRHLSDGLPAQLQPLHSVTFEFHGFRALATRTSSVGEDGFELMLAPAVAQHAIETVLAAGVRLAGNEALEAARVESCIPAFSPDLETGLSPAEADIDLLMGIPGGRERWTLAAVLIDGEALISVGTALQRDGDRVGELRSCVRSPGVRATIGLAVVEGRFAEPGRALDLAGTTATIVTKPIYRRRT